MSQPLASTAKLRHLSWARVVSDVLSPPVVWGALAFPIAFRAAKTPEQGIIWALTYTLLVCVMPALYIVYMVWRGHITDIHIKVRHQRIRPFVITLVCACIAYATLRFMDAPALLPLFALFSILQLAIMLAITLVWQISMHAMSIAGAVVVTGALYGPGAALLLTPLIPVVGAARIHLKRHTLAQVIAGGCVGATITGLLFAVGTTL